MGYSQGAAFAYTIALKNPDKIAGVIGLSGYLMELDHPNSILGTEDLEKARDLRVFMAHGNQDAAIDVERARELKTLFEEQGLDVTYREFEGQHGIDPQVLQESVAWITAD
jgi:phospholipase/carboxylesterase